MKGWLGVADGEFVLVMVVLFAWTHRHHVAEAWLHQPSSRR